MYRIGVLPTSRRVTINPFAVAIRVSVMRTDHAPGEFETGGVRVMVPLSIVVTVGVAPTEILLRAAFALLTKPTSMVESKTPVRPSAIPLFFIGPLSFFLSSFRGYDTLNSLRFSGGPESETRAENYSALVSRLINFSWHFIV